MNQENLRPNLKSQPKNLNPRGSLPSRHSRQSTHNAHQLTNIKLVGWHEAPIKSAKFNSSHDYIVRKQNIVKSEQNEVQKLTQICHQFFKQNQYLKSQVHAKNEHQTQSLLARICELEQQLNKNRVYLDERDRLINDLTTNRRKFNGDQNTNTTNDHPVHHRIIINKAQHSDSEAQRVLKLTQELQQREQQLVRFMHKQSQYIRIYVQNQQLEQQIRNMMAIAEQQSKTIEGLRKKQQISSTIKNGDSLQQIQALKNSLQRTKQYNDKLYKKLQISSEQIQRLNHILKIKLHELDNSKATTLKLQHQLCQLKQTKNVEMPFKDIKQQNNKLKSEETQCKHCTQLTVQVIQLQAVNQKNETTIEELASKLQSVNEENENFSSRINDQVDAAWQLRQIISQLESKLKLKQSPKNDRQAQTQGEYTDQKLTAKQKQQVALLNNQNKDQQSTEQNKKITYQQRLNSLRQENNQLYKFVMQQGEDIQSLRAQNSILFQENRTMKTELDKMAAKEQEIAYLLKRVSTFQDKLALVTEQYERLLNQAQSSFSETESVHKQIEMMLQDKLDLLSQDNRPVPRKQKSEAGKNIRLKTYTVGDKYIEGSPSRSDINYTQGSDLKKQNKCQSQSQLLGNI